MSPFSAENRDSLMLSAAVILGLIVPPGLAVLGLPVAAAGVAGLVYRRRFALVAIASVLGVAAATALRAVDAVYAAPAIVAVILAAVLLPRIDVQWVGLLLTVILGVADAAHEYLVMKAANITPEKYITEMVKVVAVPGSTSRQAEETVKLLLTLLPMAYFAAGLITATVVIVAVRWAGERSQRALRIPALSVLDLSPHVLWPFIAGAFSLAASYASAGSSGTLRSAGLNLVLGASCLFALQGAAVTAGLLGKMNAGRATRVFAWITFVLVNFVIPAASLVGLIDFWVNFRRLPRDGAAPPQSAAMSDS